MGIFSAREKCAWVGAVCREAALNVGLRGLDLIQETIKSHRRHLEQRILRHEPTGAIEGRVEPVGPREGPLRS